MSSTSFYKQNNSSGNFPKSSLNNISINSIRYIGPSKSNKCPQEFDIESYSAIKGFQISNSSFSSNSNKSLIFHIKSLAKEKITKKYNCTKEIYDIYIINNILRNDNCHVVTKFKDVLLDYSNLEFIINFYQRNKIKKLIEEFYNFYKNYFYFYCKPIFNCLNTNILMKNYYEIKAKCFLNIELNENSKNIENKSDKNNKSNNDTNNPENKTIETLSDSQNIFNYYVKEFLENVSDMSNVVDEDNLEDGTINLNIENEKFEIFKENKREYSNNSTFIDIVNYMNRIKRNNNDRKEKLILKKSILKCQRNMIKSNINRLVLNGKKNNKNKIPINKVNALLKKIKLKKFGKKLNKKLFLKCDNKSLSNNIKSNTINIGSNKNKDLGIKNDFLNLKNFFVYNSNLNLNYNKNFNKIEYMKINKRINTNNNNDINEYKNKENKEIINNNILNNQKHKKNNSKSKNNTKYIKENKLNNQKISFKINKISRNKKLSKDTIQDSFLNQIPNENQSSEYKSIIKKKRLVHNTYIKNKTNKRNKILSNDKSKTIVPIIKNNHYRNKTKFIRNSIEKIFKNLYQKMRRVIPNKSNLNSIHINKSHNYNISSLYNTLIVGSNMNKINNENMISYTNTNTNKSTYNNIKNLKCSINNDNSAEIKMNVSKIKYKIRNKKQLGQNYYSNFYLNSTNTTLNNKSIHLLNRTCENNIYSTNALNNYRNKKSLKSLNKNNKMNNKVKNIKSIINKNRKCSIKKLKINITENKFRNFKKINAFNTQISQKTFNDKNESKEKLSNFNIFKHYKMNSNTICVKNNSKIKNNDKDNKFKIKTTTKRNPKSKTIIINNSKIYIENGNIIIKDKANFKINNTYHNKSQSTFGINLENKRGI